MLDELESCKPPSSETLEAFLVNTVVTCDFAMREKQASLVTPQRLYKIVSNNFEQSLSLDWAKRLLRIKDNVKVSFLPVILLQISKRPGRLNMGPKFWKNSLLSAKNW